MTDYMMENGRKYPIAKSNALARITSTNSLYEQKTALYILSKITREDSEKYVADNNVRIEKIISLNDLCKVCNIPTRSEKYDEIERIFKKLAMAGFEDFTDNEGNIGRRMIAYLSNDVNINFGKRRVQVALHKNIMPHLLNLQDRFTKYEFKQILKMKSLYSSQLYEMLISYRFQRKDLDTDPDNPIYCYRVPILRLEEIKEFFGVEEKYKGRNDNFFRVVIDKAVKEINEHTDVDVYYLRKPEKGKTRFVEFKVQLKEGETGQYPEYKKEQTEEQLGIEGFEGLDEGYEEEYLFEDY